MCVHVYIYPTSPLQVRCDTRSIFYLNKVSLNSVSLLDRSDQSTGAIEYADCISDEG